MGMPVEDDVGGVVEIVVDGGRLGATMTSSSPIRALACDKGVYSRDRRRRTSPGRAQRGRWKISRAPDGRWHTRMQITEHKLTAKSESGEGGRSSQVKSRSRGGGLDGAPYDEASDDGGQWGPLQAEPTHAQVH